MSFLDLNGLSHFKQKLITKILDITHPVGSFYVSVEASDPAALFGGTWELVEDDLLTLFIYKRTK